MASPSTATTARQLSPPRRQYSGPAVSSRRIADLGTPRPAASARFSVSQRLLDRELGIRASHTFETQDFRQRFAGLRPRLVIDVFPPFNLGGGNDFISTQRSSILQIVVAPPLIIGLTEAGICSAFDMDTGRRVCVLNLSRCEVIRSLFHNRSINALIIVYLIDTDQYSAMHCRMRCTVHPACSPVRAIPARRCSPVRAAIPARRPLASSSDPVATCTTLRAQFHRRSGRRKQEQDDIFLHDGASLEPALRGV
jgi:hypothetical protein